MSDTNGNGESLSTKTSQNSLLSTRIVDRRVLVAVDPSLHSKYAFEWFLKNIWKPTDLVIILYCPEPPHLPTLSVKDGLNVPTEKWKEIISETNNKAKSLELVYESLCLDNKVNYKIRIDTSKTAGEEVIRVAESEKARMIVMGSRGIGAVKRFFLGSVSEFVTRHTKIPCVVVPNENCVHNV